MTKFANGAAYFFIFTSFVLTVISAAGIWNVFTEDVVWKSFQSIGLIALACVIILAVDGFSAKKSLSQEEVSETEGSIKGFGFFHTIAVTILITSVAVCVFLGLLSIWDIVKGDVLYKSLSSIATIGFFSLLTVIVCNKRTADMKKMLPMTVTSVTSVSPVVPATTPVTQV